MGTILQPPRPLVLDDTLQDLRVQVQKLDLKIKRDSSPPSDKPRTLPSLHLQASERPSRSEMSAVDSAADKITSSLGKNGFNSTSPYDDVRVVLARYEDTIDSIMSEDDDADAIDPIGLVACILEPHIISKMHRRLQRGSFSADPSDLDSPIEWEKVKAWLVGKYSRFESDAACIDAMKEHFYEVMPGSIAFSSTLVLQEKLGRIDVLAKTTKDESFDPKEFSQFMKSQFPLESQECDVEEVNNIDKASEALQQLFAVGKRMLAVMLGQEYDYNDDDCDYDF
ncbi:hypothetical protein B0I72DRAFT_141113 [Yarrowia lipolytica]|jgi:hypothetical protein|uniref:YALI0D10417p n=2 Tax=Yarrowia lipolytica TaxID=4952 RepID=Q6C9K7_YARLI|nr:YALI0D10417p [Yarrowia lipolytica CLIB122]AOW03878.1 hypothetical protein YALI1_D13071g [Yarrowia lipolytica]KAB8283066.1 hypothetical protein BKA91DRAFT_137425 [Yarrowia lipolytica]KAE8168990.1 hypothetical protein BKA90DRAFT_143344 [Yarrowia lipolytica]KAJ8054551.1 hypothetical protein LXG23DRAFT_21000 [Yarrowia lipolytica]QNP97766.1 Hypothetical protein YALI2_D00207g [Yarrowia lipolytica]|eukprot:XP_502655.1 YALI0D10417p [Yarrowia lipolytica CLIB122]